MRVLIFVALAAACWASGWLLGKAIHMWRALVRRRPKHARDDLMALNDSLTRCGAIVRANEPDHLWHACDHAAGHWDDARPLHHCRCGTHWANALIDDRQIRALNAMFAAPDYQHEETL